jgi:mRNA interferase HigB
VAFGKGYKESVKPLEDWYRTAKKADWNNLPQVRANYSHADLVGTCIVFNISGNKFRLITRIFFQTHKLYIVSILTHKEYDHGGWKRDCDC